VAPPTVSAVMTTGASAVPATPTLMGPVLV
jgi:hypothetical protein